MEEGEREKGGMEGGKEGGKKGRKGGRERKREGGRKELGYPLSPKAFLFPSAIVPES